MDPMKCVTCGHNIDAHRNIGCCHIDPTKGTQDCPCQESQWSASEALLAMYHAKYSAEPTEIEVVMPERPE